MHCWVMVRLPIHAALCLMLVSGPAAYAESADPPSGAELLQPGSEPAAAEGRQGPGGRNLFDGAGPGLVLSRERRLEQDGSISIGTGLVRSWSVSEGLSAGVGLFSVAHEDQREPEFRRGWNAKAVGPRNRRVAAVGLNVRF
jgi:hypothetical protein